MAQVAQEHEARVGEALRELDSRESAAASSCSRCALERSSTESSNRRSGWALIPPSDVPTSAARSPVKPGGGSLLRVGSSLRIFVAPFLRDDDDDAPGDSQDYSQQHSQQHSQEEKSAGVS